MKKTLALLLLTCVVGPTSTSPSQAQERAADAPTYTAGGELIRPTDYREWVFVTSGLGMTYGPVQPAAGRPAMFDNVFVNRDSYRRYMDTGRWPDKTIFILELRRAEANVSINNGGHTQGELAAIEAAVKDVQRFPDGGWGYFTFDSPRGIVDAATPLPSTASCYSCHRSHAAVENTFVQFYPTLMDVARRLGTVNPTYDPRRKP